MTVPSLQVGYGIARGSKQLQRFDNIPVEEPQNGEVLLKIEAAGLCRSDFHMLLIDNPALPEKMVMGHEVCGSIAKVGPNLVGDERFPVGGRFALVIADACGTCDNCRVGKDNKCLANEHKAFGLSQDGGFQQYLRVKNPRALIPIPDNVTYAQAASATDAALTPFHAVMKVKHLLFPGTKVLVYGAGGLGLNAVQILANYSCHIVVVDRKASNEKVAREFGASEFYTSAEDIPDGPETFPLCFDFVGNQDSCDGCTEYVAPCGKILLVGLGKGRFNIPNYDLARREVEYIFNFGGTSQEQKEVLRWISLGKLKPLVSTTSMDQLPQYLKKMAKGEILGRVAFIPNERASKL